MNSLALRGHVWVFGPYDIIRIDGQEFNSLRRKTRFKALHEFKLHRHKNSSISATPAGRTPSASSRVAPFQIPSVPLSRGPFYFAQIGHYHFAPTFRKLQLDSFSAFTDNM
jgi:hypothetical protein